MRFKIYPSNYAPPRPATDEEVNACEQRYGIKLPEALISLLKTQNGGDVDSEDLSEPLFENLLGVSCASDPSLLCLDPQIASLHNFLLTRGLLSSPTDTYPALENHLGDIKKLISISGTGTYHYLLDYRMRSESPKVYFLDLVGGHQELRLVSENFNSL